MVMRGLPLRNTMFIGSARIGHTGGKALRLFERAHVRRAQHCAPLELRRRVPVRHERDNLHVRVTVLHRVLHRHRRIEFAGRRVVRPARRLHRVPQLVAWAVHPRPAARARQQAVRLRRVERLRPVISRPLPPPPSSGIEAGADANAKFGEPPLHRARDEVIRRARRRHLPGRRRRLSPLCNRRQIRRRHGFALQHRIDLWLQPPDAARRRCRPICRPRQLRLLLRRVRLRRAHVEREAARRANARLDKQRIHGRRVGCRLSRPPLAVQISPPRLFCVLRMRAAQVAEMREVRVEVNGEQKGGVLLKGSAELALRKTP
eukprot:6324996-Prymnesium_polylepis.1